MAKKKEVTEVIPTIAFNAFWIKKNYSGKKDKFFDLCRNQYAEYYKGVSDEQIELEYKFLTK